METWLQIALALVAAVFSGGSVAAWMKTSYGAKIEAAKLSAEERRQANELIAKISDGKMDAVIAGNARVEAILTSQSAILERLVQISEKLVDVHRPWDGEDRRVK